MTGVFLSASFPSGDRGKEVLPYYPADIASAAAAVAEAVLRSGAALIFGGHPTISPIVLQISELLRAGEQVVIYQSEYFSDQITDEVKRLVEVGHATLRFTPGASTLAGSLAEMRREIFANELAAAFFIGGMSGIGDEYQMLRQDQQDTQCFLFDAPGGMAAIIGRDTSGLSRLDSSTVGELWASPSTSTTLLKGRSYASLALAALREVGLSRIADSNDEL